MSSVGRSDGVDVAIWALGHKVRISLVSDQNLLKKNKIR